MALGGQSKEAGKKARIGKGLDALIPSGGVTKTVEKPTKVADKDGVVNVKISKVEPNREQPRKNFDEDALQELAESIKQFGVLQPILVQERDDYYEIIAGERRWRASKMAGLTEIPAVVFDGDELKAAQVALIENIQREDLNAVEEAMGYGALIEKFGLTQDQVAKQVGKNRSTVANMLRLLDLPDEVLGLVASGALSAGHARTLLGVKSPENLIALAHLCIEKSWSVRVLEEEVKRINRPVRTSPVKEEAAPLVDYQRELELNLQRRFGRQVRIKDSGKKKCLCFFYEDNMDLTELLDALCGEDFAN